MWKFKLPTKTTYFSSEKLTPSQMFEELMEYLMKIDRKLGADIFAEDFTPFNVHFGANVLICMATLIFCGYDFYVSLKEDFFRATFCFLSLTGTIQAFGKIYTFIGSLDQVLELKDRSIEFFKRPYTSNSMKIFETRLMQVTHFGAFITALFTFCTFVFSLYPFAFYLILGKRVILLEVEIPFIDWKDSWIGYGIHIIYGFYLMFGYLLVLIAAVYVIICFLITAIIQFDTLCELLSDLNELAISNKNGENNGKIKKSISEIIEMHANLLDFIDIFEGTFSTYYFVEFGVLIIHMVVSLFAIRNFNFIPGYLVVVVATFQLFLPCFLGTVLMYKGEDFYEKVCEISWYDLPVSDQKSINLLINAATIPKTLTVGLENLDVQTFVEIYKAIYSYMMMLSNFQ